MKTRKILSLALWPLLGLGCSSAPPAPSGPAWIHQPARTVDNGYIVYVGTGQDPVEERASFKAEGQALQDLANECSFAPKGTRVEDRYETEDAGMRQDYAKVAVSFDDCEAAKSANDAEQIKKIANVGMTDEVKRYQEMMNEPTPPPIGEVGPGAGTQYAQGSAPPQAAMAGGGVFIVDQPTFFVARQQVAYVKQTVILQPTGTPPPVPVQTQLASISKSSSEIHTYEQANPTLRTTQPSWSQVSSKLPPEMRGTAPAHSNFGSANRTMGPAQPPHRTTPHPQNRRPPPSRKRRRRRD